MADSQEPGSPEPNAHEYVDIEPDPSHDVEMPDVDRPSEQSEQMPDRPEAAAALREENALKLTETELSSSNDINITENDQMLDGGESSLDQPATEMALPEVTAAESTGYMPSMTDDMDMFDDFGANVYGDQVPKSEPEPSQNDAFGVPEADFITSNNASPVESDRPLDFGDCSLGKSRSEKTLPEGSAGDVAAAVPHDPEDVPPIESAGDVTPTTSHGPGNVSPVERAGDITPAATRASESISSPEITRDASPAAPESSKHASLVESDRPLDFGQSLLSKPKKPVNLGSSTLNTPASQAARGKAKAMQLRLAKQFAERTTSATPSVPSSNFSALGLGESPHSQDAEEGANSVASGSFVPPEFGESAANVSTEHAEFEALKEAYALKKRAGTNDIESDVAFLKAEAKEMARRRKAVADEHFERESSPEADESESEALFMSPATRTPASHAPDSSGGETPKSSFFTNGTRPRKRKADNAGDMAPPKKKQPRKPKAPTGRSLGAGKGGKVLTDEDINRTLNSMNTGKKQALAKQAVSKKPKTGGRQPNHDISNVGSLLTGTDVFADALAVAGHSTQPGFRPGIMRKDFALRDLIASVPQDERAGATGDKKFLEMSLKDFDGQGSCKPSLDGTGWTLKGMKCTLKHYQVLGVAFMRKRENVAEHPRGGILADEMGLGKTIQMIANIINGKPKEGQPRTTLIVASPALISQWHAEINKFAMTRKESKRHGIARVIQHRAGYRQGGDATQIKEAIEESDICLTTYSEILRSYPKAVIPAELTTERSKAEWWIQHFRENKGVFHDMKFLRVVLDEAQAIKNHTGHCSMACRALSSEYYWAISGTPLVNGISEMYPYLKFLRHPHTGSMRTFQANFCSPNDPTGSEKLGVFLRQIIIRRTHKDTLFGARLLDLPTPKRQVIYLEFNAVERTVYEIVKQRFIQRINTITRRDGINAQTQYTHIWTMLLRLRQICAHVLLIQGTIMELLEREDFEKLEKLTRELQGQSQDSDAVLVEISHMLREHHKIGVTDGQAAEASVAGIDLDVVPGVSNSIGGSTLSLGKRHGKTYDFHKYLTSAAQSEEMDAVNKRATCCSCRQKPVNPQVTSCHHIYCKGCVRKLQHDAARSARDGARCSFCGEVFVRVDDLLDISESDIAETDGSPTSSGSSQESGTGKKKKSKKEELDWIGQQGAILPSAKTIACKAQILAWLAEVPTCKIIVYTQFLPMIRIMGRVCQGEGWGHLKYSGAMSHSAREKALQIFAKDPSKKIMLMSLKCGGLGLNIVSASRVLLLDPWWNDAVEQQAFCRVFRIGQTSETRLTRLCIKSSMDSAMFAVKERKSAEIEKVMEESKPTGPKSTAELLALFGPVGDDEDGRPGFIFPEHDPDENDVDVAERFYEREEQTSVFHRGQPEGFMGNDL